MTTYIPTKDTAQLIRQSLRATFPVQKFSERCGTGTAHAWISVIWTDGPTTDAVDAIVFPFEGRRYNVMTDTYDTQSSRLVSVDVTQLPEQVRYHCDGVSTQRSYSSAAYLLAQALVAQSDRPDVVVCDSDGVPNYSGNLWGEIVVDGVVHHDLYSPGGLAQHILRSRDLRDVITA